MYEHHSHSDRHLTLTKDVVVKEELLDNICGICTPAGIFEVKVDGVESILK